jgi:hypothetical protein
MELNRWRQMVAPGARGIEALHTVDDFRAAARKRLPRMVYDFVDGGADGELALTANRQALDSVLFSPRFMVDVAERDQTTTVFGRKIPLPFCLRQVSPPWFIQKANLRSHERPLQPVSSSVSRPGRGIRSRRLPTLLTGIFGSSSICGRAKRSCNH